ncbi:MAG: hypothetical protein NZ742_02015 [Acidobacteria bacterium]|nr:hypothetical protein [Acidobacteriota bacterium]MDW7983610.1 hypothetical protein [Acidobacteriota bacterium]
MPTRIVVCPSCGRKARFQEEPYQGHRVLIRCRQCTYEWWVEVGLEVDVTSGAVPDAAIQQARRLARFIVNEIRYYHQDFIQKAQTRQEILEELKDDLSLARTHYLSRIPPELQSEGPTLFQEALQEILLEGKK